MKSTRGILLAAFALAACGGDSPTSIASKTLTSGGLPAAQGNQSPVSVDPTGLCAGKETFKSVTGDVRYCVLSSDLSIQGGLCHFVKPEDPLVLRHKIGVITGSVGAYLKEPLGFSANENDCGAVPEEGAGKGLILIEEADASGGAEIPPNSEKVLTFAFTRDAAECGRVQSVADLLTQDGTSLKVAGFVLNYPKACTSCITLFSGSSLNNPEFVLEELQYNLGVFPLGEEFTVPAGWTVTIDASVSGPFEEVIDDSRRGHGPFSTTARSGKTSAFNRAGDKKLRSQAYNSVLAAALTCTDGVNPPTFIDSSSSDGSLHFVQPFETEATCFAVIATASPNTKYVVKKCPGLTGPNNDEGPLYDDECPQCECEEEECEQPVPEGAAR
jgi:hypothetical protein